MLRLALLFCLFTTLAQAGAWPRDKGSGFASASVRLVWPKDFSTGLQSRYSTIYLEYGVTSKLTVGLDLGHSVSGGHKQIGFLRYPLLTWNDWRVASEFGYGTIQDRRVLRPTLSLGRGIKTQEGYGWFAADGTAEVDLETTQMDMKLDVTLGLPMDSSKTAVLQVQSGIPAGQNLFMRLAPSLVWSVTQTTRIEIGATLGMTDNTGHGFKLGIWRDF